jgi:SpoVK/Ycf46/Vps4 family AAA+-type ATPase
MRKRESLREAGGRPGPSDPHLLSRMEEYGRKHGLSDMDAALEYLRGKYPEYRRKQAVPFRKYLASQVPEVQRRMDAHKEKERAKEPEVRNPPRSRAEEENRLQEIEHAHVIDRNGAGDMNEDLAFDVSSPNGHNPDEKPAFAPPHVIAELLKAKTPQIRKSPIKSSEPAIEERGSPPAQSSGRPLPQPMRASSQFQGSVVQQENGRPYLALASKGKQSEDRESAVVLQEGKIIRKRERETEKARAGSKKGKWGHERGEAEGPPASSAAAVPRNVSFKDLGGIEGTLGMIRELIEYPLVHPDLYDWLGVQPPRGVLLHGPPGCGKTMLANAIAAETGVPFLKISAPEVVSGMSGMLLKISANFLSQCNMYSQTSFMSPLRDNRCAPITYNAPVQSHVSTLG